MAKTLCFDKNIFIIVLLLITIIIILGHLYIESTRNKPLSQQIPPNNSEKFSDNQSNKFSENYQANKEVITTINYPQPLINRDPNTVNSLDRIYNPIRYPYKSDYYYEQDWYPNLDLPFQVIGCGSRNTPCLGGTQVPIYNPPTPIDISNTNIAPINISTRGPLGQPQQIGILYQVFGKDNDVLPLFGRKKYPNDNKYEYYTIMGQFGVKVPVIAKNRDELGSNDIVFVKGRSQPYTVTIYETDFPSYIPY